MKTSQLFHPDFVAAAEVILNERCINGETVSRAELCRALDLTSEDKSEKLALENMVGSLISLGGLENYEIRPGRYGGIGKMGEKRPKSVSNAKPKNDNKTNKPATFPEGFLDNLHAQLQALSENGVPVTRRALAEAMGSPGSNTELLISKAYKTGLIEGYVTKIGPNGGFVRVDAGIETEEDNGPETQRGNQQTNSDDTSSAQI